MITNLANYIDEVENVIKNWLPQSSSLNLWFRGQSDSSWKLKPTINRSDLKPDLEREITRDFITRSGELAKPRPKSYLQWLILMQHHGLQTRLIDWTESTLVALYFAVRDYKKKCDAAVWILHPWNLNNVSIDTHGIPWYKSEILKKYQLTEKDSSFTRRVKASLPAAFRPSRNFARIVAQRGMFTIHGSLDIGLDELIDHQDSYPNERFLTKIIIDGDSKLSILRQLYYSGITESVLFPELDGLAHEISFRYSKSF